MKNQRIKLSPNQVKELIFYKETKDCSSSELKRIQSVLLINKGHGPELLKELTGYTKKYAFELRKKYLKSGIEELKDKQKKEPRALLTKGQRKQIISVLQTQTPRAFGWDDDYWAPYMIGRLIKEQYNVYYKSKTSLYLLFREAKFTYHKPDQQYKNRDEKVIDGWKTKNIAQINASMNDENTIVLVEDEMMLSTRTTTQKIWLPRGEFPKIDVSSERKIRCIYGFLNVKNGREHAFKTQRANSKESVSLLTKISDIYPNKKIVLIWDNASWHKSAEIKDFLAKTKRNFHLISFPPYAPDLNPQEHVWKEGRKCVTHNTFIKNIDKATDDFVAYLNNTLFDYKFL